jgi:hypothetical protein
MSMLSPRSVLLAAMLPYALQSASLPVVTARSGPVRSESIPLGRLATEHQYSLLYSLSSLGTLRGEVRVEIVQGSASLLEKTLHAGDPDFYTQFRVSRNSDVSLRINAPAGSGKYTLQVNRWPRTPHVRSGPLQRWQDAMPVELDTVVFASGDDASYVPLDLHARRANVESPSATDWYRFEFDGLKPKLVFFQVELTDRDQIPVSVTIHRVANGKLEEFYEGEDPVTLPHEVQALPGNKFTPRILKDRGTYYIAVRASHPEYKLRTRLYDPPPYSNPQAGV